jgi:TRAP-type C4-dicarboxylate transport system permease small subunit
MTTEPGDAPAGQEPEPDRIGREIAEASRRQELSDPDLGLPRLDRAVNRVAEVIGVAVFCTIVGTIFANAVGRYAFDLNLIWAEELVLLLVPWLAMTGVFLAVRRGTMIRIEFFFDKLPPLFRGPAGAAGTVLCIAVLVFLGTISSQHLALFGGDRTPYLDLPKGLSSAALVIGGFAAAAAFLAALVRDVVASRKSPPE